jgi:hypothetical protein
VDLAGSERIHKTLVQAMRKEEAKNINTSLSALGQGGSGFVPFRDTALTKLMKESLSGDYRTSLIVTVSESIDMVSESKSSLRFGLSCGKIPNNASK